MDKHSNPREQRQVTRRDFLRLAAITGGTAALLGGMPGYKQLIALAATNGSKYPLVEAINQINTICQQCNTGCAIKVKLYNGVAAKIDGNPYSPWTTWPHPAFKTPLKDLAATGGAICPKGQAGLQTAYDPYRIVSVLKRKPGTKRGENQWVTIPFDKAIEEIVEGGNLFGEGNVEGLRSLYALKDPALAKKMSDAINAIWNEKDAEKKKTLTEDFKTTFKDNLDVLIDPNHPDMGPKNNQFSFVWGRLKNGRGDLFKRFVGDSFGSINANGHTTVCQGSLYFTGKAMSEQFDAATAKFTGGAKFYWQGDIGNSEFVLFVGANLFEANYGPPYRIPKLTRGLAEGGSKFAVLDPRMSKSASHAWKWVPVKPGQDLAVAMGMIRWIIDNERYNRTFLSNTNKAAATASGEKSWTTGSWLVKTKDGKPGKFLRASEIALVEKGTKKDDKGKDVTIYTSSDGVVYTFDPFVALVDGQAVPFDPNSAELAVQGEPLAQGKLQEIDYKTGLQIIYEASQEHTIGEWAEMAGIRESDIVDLAEEFTSHGTRAVVDVHRGASQHTNGFYTVLAWFTINCLIGNPDHVGGMIKGTSYDYLGAKAKGPFDFSKMYDGKNAKLGLDILRTTTTYEKSTFADGTYPTPRPWFPLATDLYQENFPSMGDAYPYQIKALMLYMSAANYSLPSGHTVSDILADSKKIPLIFTSDIIVGETSQYADFIFPDLTYLEHWEFHGTHPSVPWKVENIRQPAISIPGWPTVTVYGEEQPLAAEAMMMAIAEKLELPGFGPNGFGEGVPFTRPEHMYLKQVANIAFGEAQDGSGSVPEADDEEVDIFTQARRNLPKTIFDLDTWKAAIGNNDSLWRKVVYVLNRGGRYDDFAKGYKGNMVANAYGKQMNLYQEKTATTINTMTGKTLAGYPKYIAPGLSSLGEEIVDTGYDFTLITHKAIHMTKARTITNYWLLALMPEGPLWLNAQDAKRLNLKDGDQVKISSASNPEGVWDMHDGTQKPMIGKVRVVEGMRPGVVSFALGYGHWASGARGIVIDGISIPGDNRRAAGFHANAAMRVDPHLGNVTLTDLVGGSAVFYDGKVRLAKV